MSENFQVGDIVECVDARRYTARVGLIVLGGLYTIAGLGVTRKSGAPAVWIKEMIDDPNYIGHRASRFRKIHRPRAEFLTELLSRPIELDGASPRQKEDA